MTDRTKIVLYLTEQEEEAVRELRATDAYKECKKAYMAAREAVRLFRETDEYKSWPVIARLQGIKMIETQEDANKFDDAFEISYKNVKEAGSFFREARDMFYDTIEYKNFMRPLNHPKIAKIRYDPMSIIGTEEYDLILNVPVDNISVVQERNHYDDDDD